MADNNDIPKGVKLLGAFWPIGLAGLTLLAAGIQVQAQVATVERDVLELKTSGPANMRERLATIEATQRLTINQLNRMEHKLDDLDKRSRNRNLNGL